jgi:hypothetical protein
MTDTSDRFKPKDRRKASRVKHISVSAEAKKAYEAVVEERDERERTYAKHLAPDTRR